MEPFAIDASDSKKLKSLPLFSWSHDILPLCVSSMQNTFWKFRHAWLANNVFGSLIYLFEPVALCRVH
jgi:hypothetical protein